MKINKHFKDQYQDLFTTKSEHEIGKTTYVVNRHFSETNKLRDLMMDVLDAQNLRELQRKD